MRVIYFGLALAAAASALAAGYNSRDAGICYGYAIAAKKPALKSSVEALADAYGGGKQAAVQAKVFVNRINAQTARDRKAAAWALVSEGRAACKAIGAM